MKLVTFSIERLKSMPRPEEYIDELQACAVSVVHDSMTFDVHSECYLKLKEKYKVYRPTDRDQKKARATIGKINSQRWGVAASRLVHGVVGYAKATLGVDPAPDKVVQARLSICQACAEVRGCVGDSVSKCCGRLLNVLTPTSPTCGCRIDKKARVASESCPLKKW